MGILADALSITLGVWLGSCCKQKREGRLHQYFAIAIMMISLFGLIENIFTVPSDRLLGEDTVIVIFSFMVGGLVGELFRFDERISRFAKGERRSWSGVLDATLLFGIGGLQISGPILMAVSGDHSQLYLKALVDFPFALLIGASYGRLPMLSAIPVAMLQGLIALLADLLGDFVSESLLMSLCAVGFMILFFTGFNMLCKPENRIKNINMVPSMVFVILFHMGKTVIL